MTGNAFRIGRLPGAGPVVSGHFLSNRYEIMRFWILLICLASVGTGFGQTNLVDAPAATNAPSKFRSAEDGWFDISGFLDEKYGFLPIVIPITEPAVGYGALGGIAFISQPLGKSVGSLERPDITAVGGLGTGNGSWGAGAVDIRHWFQNRLQTQVAAVYASINLDYYGLGNDSILNGHPLRYTLEPRGVMLTPRYQFGGSHFWAGLGYTFSATEVSFQAPAGTPGLPSFSHEINVGGLLPSATYDTRDNVFTPNRGMYLEAAGGLYSPSLGGDTDFQKANLLYIQYVPLGDRWFLGVRSEVAASFGNCPFYMRPYLTLRGAPAMRYQGQEIAQIEPELRWQFWKRYSAIVFVGGGGAWNSFQQFKNSEGIVTGGLGFRYELARKYGIHAGFDVAFSADTVALYIQVGSAWARP
ncbi:MAG: BamA/TamA family outer membrane protein [Verrucomicrobiota bacterium]